MPRVSLADRAGPVCETAPRADWGPLGTSRTREKGRGMGKAAIHPGVTTDSTVHGAGVWSMATGTVKWFNAEKGYGFVTPDDGGRDLFVHYTGIEGSGYRTLSEGQKVEYEATEGQKGPQATKVRVLA